MKIGDKVRFLNEVGGGIVKGFQSNNIVLVEDEDGFDIPVNIHECVVVETDDYHIDPLKKKSVEPSAPQEKKEASSVKMELNRDFQEEEVEDNRPVTFRAAPVERRNADILNVYLCFDPIEVDEITKTDFDTYLINDSNYFLDFTYLSAESKGWQLRYRGTAEPNTKVFMETFSRDNLNDLQHLCIQATAYKENKYFLLKSPFSVELRPDLTKFYKLHTFAPNEFFKERVLTFDIIVNDHAARQVFVQAEDVREALLGDNKKSDEPEHTHIHAIAIKKEQHDDIDIVDLHAGQLLDNMDGMKPADIMEYQLDVVKKKMEACKNEKGKKIIFIHGKGQGVLRNAILRELRLSYKTCTSQDASFREYGFGATMVIIH